MDQTVEKMADEKANMMGNQFFGKVSHDDPKECVAMSVVGVIKNQVIVLEEELNDAKLRYADVALEEENWSAKYERKQACKILEGQIAILNKVEQDIESMLTPMSKPMAMAV